MHVYSECVCLCAVCVCVCSTTTHSLLKGHVGSDYSQTQSMCVENLCCSVTISPSLPPSFLSINSFSPSLYLLSRRRGSMTEVFYELPPKQPKFVAKCKLYHKPYRFTMTSKLTRLNDVHPIEFWALKTKHSWLSTLYFLFRTVLLQLKDSWYNFKPTTQPHWK